MIVANKYNRGWMMSLFAVVMILILAVIIMSISTRVTLSLNRGADSYSERQAYWNAHSAVSVWESGQQFPATTTYNSVNGWDTGEIIIDSTGMKGIGKTGSDSNIVWIVELDEREEQGGGADLGTEYTFTNCEQEGRTGPTQEQVDATYNVENNTLNDAVTITTPGIQEWTVVHTGTYSIEAYGAQGGPADYYNPAGQLRESFVGGLGARMRGDFSLTQGDVIKIVVGQMGKTTTDEAAAGGGGGTFIVKSPYNSNSSILVIAGGGGGVGKAYFHTGLNGQPGLTGTTGGDPNPVNGGGVGGINGNGASCPSNGCYAIGGGGGGGFFTAGYDCTSRKSKGGSAFTSNPTGGEGSFSNSPDVVLGVGGYGGGGGGSTQCGYGGGGGGYSGGGGGGWRSGCGGSGGGGGSYNAGTNQENTAGANSGHGFVIITVME